MLVVVYVREQYRRNGVGKKLLGYCVERGRELGCTGVEWVVNKWNDVGKKMYEGVGATYLDDGVWELMTLNKEGMENILRGQAANGI